MKPRIRLSENLYPAEAFFNAINTEKFLLALKRFAEGHGINPENKTCDFPADLAEEDGGPVERFGFIEFWTYAGNQEVKVTFAEFLKILEQAVKGQILETPELEETLLIHLSRVRKKILELELSHQNYLKH